MCKGEPSGLWPLRGEEVRSYSWGSCIRVPQSWLFMNSFRHWTIAGTIQEVSGSLAEERSPAFLTRTRRLSSTHQYLTCKPKRAQRTLFFFKKNATTASLLCCPGNNFGTCKTSWRVWSAFAVILWRFCYKEMLTADAVVRVKTIFREVKERSDSFDGTIFYISKKKKKKKAGQSSPSSCSLYFSFVKVVA